MATFYWSEDQGDDEDGKSQEDAELEWDLQGNSRVGANIKAENISARFEFGVGESDVTSRRLYGVWNFGAGTMKVGKDYTPVKQFISGQVHNGDLGLLNVGAAYGGRHGQIAFGFGGFEIALINPSTSGAEARNLVFGGVTFNANLVDDNDVDTIVPKIEAQWGMSFDTWNFNLIGGYNYFCVEDVISLEDNKKNDLDVNSYILGADAGFNFGPAYVKGALSFGRNIGNADWSAGGEGTYGGTDGLAQWDGDDDTNDAETGQAALVGGFKLSDMFAFEAGFGVRKDSIDGGDVKDTTPWAVYLQSVIALAPGVYIIPEVGYYDYDNNSDGDDAGSLFYIGGKWQINF
jgi:hypothetical protein